jgi:tetratricopeptide (TPR) repeat protein
MSSFWKSFGSGFSANIAKMFHKDTPSRSHCYKKGDAVGISFNICEFLGQGGYGQVYRAYFRNSGKDCALKTFHDKFLVSPAQRELFRREVTLWVGLERHPHIVPAYLVEEIHGRLFVAMEYVEPDSRDVSFDGKDRVSLFRYLSGIPIDVERILQWSIQFCFGMEHANRQGIQAHLDIKPQNILIDRDGNVKISDFGLAKTSKSTPKDEQDGTFPSSDSRTIEGVALNKQNPIRGTPGYIAPEVFREGAQIADVRSDIFSFGLVLWQMACASRVPPFHVPCASNPKEYAEQVYAQQMTKPPVPIDSPLWPLIRLMLKSNPSERCRNFTELREELQGLLLHLTGRRISVPVKLPLSADSWVNIGISLGALGKHDQAIIHYDNAIELDPNYIYAYINKGSALRHLNRNTEAMQWYEHALAQGSDSNKALAFAWHGKANVLTSLSRYQEAISAYDKALAIDSGFWVAWGGKAHAYELYGNDEAATTCYEEVIKHDSRDIGALTGKALALQRLGEEKEALPLLDIALDVNPSDPVIWNTKGGILNNQKEYQQALACFDRALEIDDSTVMFWENRARVLFNLGRLAEAIDCLKQALKLNPDQTSALFAKAVAEDKIGRRQAAKASYQAFIDTAGPMDSWIEVARQRLKEIGGE